MKKLIAVGVVAAMVLAIGSTASAGLSVVGTGTVTSSGGGSYKLIYDDAQDITWLDFSRSVDSWDNQKSWAADLAVSFGGQTFDQWRLPSPTPGATPMDIGYGITTSEMGHLYYVSLGKKDFGPLGDATPFDNLLVGAHWTNTAFDAFNTWIFAIGDGIQVPAELAVDRYSIAVMDGQVPEPATMTLLGLGLAGLIARRRKQRA